jgi:glycerol-3-phosphate cytidylyltransferase
MTTRAITFGAFDLLHFGHMRFLAAMAQMADEVYVGLASDVVVMSGKKRAPIYDYSIRREMLLHTRYVNHVLCHDGPIDGAGRVLIRQQKIRFIERYHIDLVVMGDDWLGEYGFLNQYCRVTYLQRTPSVSTSQLRQTLTNE